MHSFEHIIDSITSNLQNTLPGEKAHLELWPEGRKLFEVNTPLKSAAVLILIYPDENNNASTVFIKRSSYDGHHSDQISLPGGKVDTNDKSLEETAIRESHEEIGINRQDVNIIGALSNIQIPTSSFNVTPFIGIIPYNPLFKADNNEVADIITISLTELIDLQIQFTHKLIKNTSYKIPYFPLNKEVLWGATAMIINELRYVLKNGKTDF